MQSILSSMRASLLLLVWPRVDEHPYFPQPCSCWTLRGVKRWNEHDLLPLGAGGKGRWKSPLLSDQELGPDSPSLSFDLSPQCLESDVGEAVLARSTTRSWRNLSSAWSLWPPCFPSWPKIDYFHFGDEEWGLLDTFASEFSWSWMCRQVG